MLSYGVSMKLKGLLGPYIEQLLFYDFCKFAFVNYRCYLQNANTWRGHLIKSSKQAIHYYPIQYMHVLYIHFLLQILLYVDCL